MAMVASGLAALVGLLHVYFLVLEMFLWTTPRGLKVFGMSKEQAEATATLAKNQGLYNGFLAAGLFWSLVASPPVALQVRLFFLGCVTVAGVYGAATASRKILFVQALPALLAMGAALLAS